MATKRTLTELLFFKGEIILLSTLFGVCVYMWADNPWAGFTALMASLCYTKVHISDDTEE